MENSINFVNAILFIGSGAKITFQLLTGGLFIGLSLGIILAILRYKNMGKWFVTWYVSLIRGTPLLLQLSFVYFVSPSLFGIKFEIVTAGIISFGLNSAAYVAEIFRAGIESIPKKQFEAAKTLKISAFYMWKDIILPQVFTNILPAIINEVIALLKETAIIATIGGADIMRKSQIFAAEQFTYFTPLCIAGAYYYGIVLLVEFFTKKLEKKMCYAKH